MKFINVLPDMIFFRVSIVQRSKSVSFGPLFLTAKPVDCCPGNNPCKQWLIFLYAFISANQSEQYKQSILRDATHLQVTLCLLAFSFIAKDDVGNSSMSPVRSLWVARLLGPVIPSCCNLTSDSMAKDWAGGPYCARVATLATTKNP